MPVSQISLEYEIYSDDSLQQDSPWLPGEEVPVSHGSYFWYAHKEGLLAPNNANIVSVISHTRVM